MEEPVMRMRGLLALALALFTGVLPAYAQDTGSVSGAVFDASGAVLPGVTVRISGPKLPAGRTTQTNENGLYSFTLLLPGEYVVELEQQGTGKTTRPVIVAVG